MTTTFKHNGVEITLNEKTGKFTAQTASGPITSASLDSIKKKLDNAGVFTQFKAFYLEGYSYDRLVECTVLGICKDRSRNYPRAMWRTDKGDMYAVYADTPENRKAIEAYVALRKEHARIKEEQDKAQHAALAAIVKCKPEATK